MLNQVAIQVVEATPPAEGGVKDVDLATVVLIIKTLVSLYECFKKNPAKAASICALPLVNTWFLRAAYNNSGLPLTRQQKKRLTVGFLAVGDTITKSDIENIVKEIST